MYSQFRNLTEQQKETVKNLLQEIQQQESTARLKEISDILLNSLMKSERDIFVRKNTDNKADGYYSRSLMS